MATETTLDSLKINQLTKAQYDALTPNEHELYFITDDDYAAHPHNCYVKAVTSAVTACFQINANSYSSAEAITDFTSLISAFPETAIPASGLVFDVNKNLIGVVTGVYVGLSNPECKVYYTKKTTPSGIESFSFSDITESTFADVVPAAE